MYYIYNKIYFYLIGSSNIKSYLQSKWYSTSQSEYLITNPNDFGLTAKVCDEWLFLVTHKNLIVQMQFDEIKIRIYWVFCIFDISKQWISLFYVLCWFSNASFGKTIKFSVFSLFSQAFPHQNKLTAEFPAQ